VVLLAFFPVGMIPSAECLFCSVDACFLSILVAGFSCFLSWSVFMVSFCLPVYLIFLIVRFCRLPLFCLFCSLPPLVLFIVGRFFLSEADCSTRWVPWFGFGFYFFFPLGRLNSVLRVINCVVSSYNLLGSFSCPFYLFGLLVSPFMCLCDYLPFWVILSIPVWCFSLCSVPLKSCVLLFGFSIYIFLWWAFLLICGSR